MNYQEKYLKYKLKYIALKRQLGGFKLDLTEWRSISTSGEQNCGIYISDKYLDYIVKCERMINTDNIKHINEINSQKQLFPKIIDNQIIENKHYIIMQKMDGDITDIYFDVLPKITLNNMLKEGKINQQQKDNLLILFKGKIKYTYQSPNAINLIFNSKIQLDCLIDDSIYTEYKQLYIKNPKIKGTTNNIIINGKMYDDLFFDDIEKFEKDITDLKNKIIKLNAMSNITLELYDTFIDELTKLWSYYYPIIAKEIIKIKILLLELGFIFTDNRYDNFGFIINSLPLDNDYRKDKVPKILDGYLYVYFLDWDNSLYQANSRDSEFIETYTEEIIDAMNNNCENYSFARGNNLLNYINISKLKSIYNINQLLNSEIIKILEKEYIFNLYEFNLKPKFKNYDQLKKKLFES
jgi:hypothetical protein